LTGPVLVGFSLVPLVFMLAYVAIHRLRHRNEAGGEQMEDDESMAAADAVWEKAMRSRPWYALFLVYLVGVIVWIYGVTTGSLLFAAGGLVFVADSYLFAPRVRRWAARLDAQANRSA
jgi:hypothetical protein